MYLLHVTPKITEALNTGNYCIGPFLDHKKAFDVHCHQILLRKITYVIIIILCWTDQSRKKV
jgi:hypothetical protein